MLRLTHSLLLSFFTTLAVAAQCLVPTPAQPVVASYETSFDGFKNEVEAFPGYVGLNAQLATSGGLNNSGSLAIDYPGNGTSDWLCVINSPCYDISQLVEPELHVQVNRGAGGQFAFSFQVSADGGATWLLPVNPEDYPNFSPVGRSDDWFDFFIDLSNVAGSNNFAWRVAVAAAPEFNGVIALDDVRVGERLCGTGVAVEALSTSTTSALNDGAIDLTVSGGTAPYNYTWTNGATTEDLTGLSSNAYEVVTRDVLGCFNQSGIYVSQPLPITLTKSNFPYNYDFENRGLGLLRQNTGDQVNWKRAQDRTSTPSTGPQPFINFPAGSQFRYVEAGNGKTQRTAVVTTKKFLSMFGTAQPTAQVAYNLFGVDQGTFAIEASGDGGLTWRRVFSESGQQGWWWKTATVDLSTFNSGQTLVRMVGTTSGNGVTSDVAIDQFFLGEANDAPAVQVPPVFNREGDDQQIADSAVAVGESENWISGNQVTAETIEALVKRPNIVVIDEVSLPQPAVEVVNEAAVASCSLCILEDDLLTPYPNPVKSGGVVTVRTEASFQNEVLVDIPGVGKLQASLLDESAFTFVVPVGLPAGLHFVRVIDGDQVSAFKLIVQ